ncbi:hypothetical protein MKX01_027497 [Papaver californicum]|nr:hypothetical protein MKX01_027497 [Papaver californicum]
MVLQMKKVLQLKKDKPIKVPALSASRESIFWSFGKWTDCGSRPRALDTGVYMELRLNHENIIELVGSYVDGSPRFPAYEFDTIGSLLKPDNIIKLVGDCVDGSLRVPAYEFDTFGSLYDILHGEIEGAPPGQVLSWLHLFIYFYMECVYHSYCNKNSFNFAGSGLFTNPCMLKHDNVIEFDGCGVDGKSPCDLAYEFDAIGSLREILDGGKGDIEGAPQGQVLSWAQRFQIAMDVAKGLRHLHDEEQPKTIHHDINSSNVLLFKDNAAKTADSDSSNRTPVVVARLATFDMGPFGNAMPGQPDQDTDIYKYGVILLELITGRKPVDLTQPEGEQKLVEWYMKSFSSYEVVFGSSSYMNFDKVVQCVDQRLGKDYVPKAVEKVAGLAELCLDGQFQFPPTMDYVIKYFELILLELDAGLYD